MQQLQIQTTMPATATNKPAPTGYTMTTNIAECPGDFTTALNSGGLCGPRTTTRNSGVVNTSTIDAAKCLLDPAKMTVVIAGQPNAGKSSLLNSIQPGLGLSIRSVSQVTEKGRHTTVVRQLFPLEGGGYVADTPGLKALALWDIHPEELDGYFPELRGLVAYCQFSDCTHVHEPGCAVQSALRRGEVHPERYASYVKMRLGQEE